MTSPTSPTEKAEHFLALHVPRTPLLMPNAWDIGSAKLFESLGVGAIATTSGGFAASRGRLDGAMSREEVLEHSGELVDAVDIPVSGDLENCFADDPEGVADTITAAIGRGLAGGSVEDFTRDRDAPDLRAGRGGGAGAGRRRGRPLGTGPLRADGPRRELPARPGGPGRHHHPAPDLPGGRRGRALRPTRGRSGRAAPVAGGRRPAGERVGDAGRALHRRAGRARREPHLGRGRHRRRVVRFRRRGGPPAPGEGDDELLGAGRRRARAAPCEQAFVKP